MRISFLVSFFLISINLFSQNNAVLSGIIFDESDSVPLAFANVYLKDTQFGVTTDIDGNYSLTIAPGNYTLLIDYLGYETAEVPFEIKSGEFKKLNHVLKQKGIQMNEVIIESVANKGKESAILAEQKKAVEIKQSIGAQEISRKGIGDAESAVTKITGVSKQEGVKNIFVRGLGDRYNSTSFNGFPLASDDPEYKNISLDLFTSDVIENVEVSKVFKSTLYSDVAGANVNIVSKDFTANKSFEISMGTGSNNGIPSKVYLPDGYSYFGFPKNIVEVPIRNLSIYSFDTHFKPTSVEPILNSDFFISGGKKFNLAENKSLSIFLALKSSNDFNYREGVTRQINSEGGAGLDMNYTKYGNNSQQNAMLNLKLKMSESTKVYFNSLFIHNANYSNADYTGYATKINDNDDALNSFIRRQQHNSNNLIVNQFISEFNIGSKIQTKVGVSNNMILSTEPDRKTNSYNFNGAYNIATNTSSLNNRFFSKLNENDLIGKISFSYSKELKNPEIWNLSFGGDFRTTKRNYDFTQINFDFASNRQINIDRPDLLFNQEYLDLGKENNGFEMETGRGVNENALDPFYYESVRFIYAGFAQIYLPFNEKFSIDAGIRMENAYQKTDWDTNLSSSVNNLTIDPSEIEKLFFLPNVNLKYLFNSNNVLRSAFSTSYTFPQFKETATFLYEDVDFSSFGNPYLTYASNFNVDLKYDWYLSKKELISIGTFYKFIKNPINRVSITSAANELSYVNTEEASVAGFEFELRKNLFNIGSEKEHDLSLGFNASYLYSKQVLNDNPNDNLTFSPTNNEDMLEGASPFIINGDISYYFSGTKNTLMSTLVANTFSERIYSIGTGGNQNIMEKGIISLDWVNKFEVKNKKLGFGFKIKNILNPDYELYKSTTKNNVTKNSIIRNYKKGITGSFSITWKI